MQHSITVKKILPAESVIKASQNTQQFHTYTVAQIIVIPSSNETNSLIPGNFIYTYTHHLPM